MVYVDASELRILGASFRASSLAMTSEAEERISAGAHSIEARAKALTPIDKGELKDSITTDLDGLSAEIGPTAFYGGYVEQGTDGPYPIPNAYGWDVTLMHPANAPEPYLGPAFDAEIDPITDSLAELGDL